MKALEKITGNDLAEMSLQEREEFSQELYREMRPRLIASAMKILHSQPDAEDACQQTFLKCHQFISEGRLNGHLLAWVWTVHMRNVLKLCEDRERSVHTTDEIKDISYSVLSEEKNEMIAKVWHAVDFLPPRQRQVFLLIHQEGFSQEQVMSMLGVTGETVRQNYSRARKALQHILSPWLDEPDKTQ